MNSRIKEKNLTVYQRSIESLAENKDSMVFLNSGKEHAAIVMGNIFKHAKENVRIFAGNFNGAVSCNPYYQENLSNFLKRGGNLKILLQEYNKNKPPEIFNLFTSFDFFYPENVDLKVSNATVVSDIDKNAVHFAIGDETMYRLENDTENYIAKGSFNDSEKSKYLIKIFDEIYQDSTEKIL